MSGLARQTGKMTFEEFIHESQNWEGVWELRNGVPTPKYQFASETKMIAASRAHSKISKNILIELMRQLDGRKCQPYGNNLAFPNKPKNTEGYVPDVSVDCGENEGLDQESYKLIEPILLVEVLSPNSSDGRSGQLDFDFKIADYKANTFVHYIVIVDQYEPRVNLHWRDEEGAWRLDRIIGLDQSISCPKLEATLRMQDIYRGVSFRPEETS